jgi:Na+-driven multidrug efflux pump
LVAQAHGRGNPTAARHAIRQGMAIGLITGLLLMPFLWLMTPVMVWMGVSAEVIPITGEYLFAVSWGLPLVGIFLALRNGGDGLAKPRLSMFAGFFGLLVNIIANYLLIYGKLGLPALGGAGCGWATSLSLLAMLLFMAFLLKKKPDPRHRKPLCPTRRNPGSLHGLIFPSGPAHRTGPVHRMLDLCTSSPCSSPNWAPRWWRRIRSHSTSPRSSTCCPTACPPP